MLLLDLSLTLGSLVYHIIECCHLPRAQSFNLLEVQH